ncbi:hypothetical protein [Scopulibacillus cellulosilyticus]|uniref:Uncharacterized protein n=1 Tax=Scopulibacillus cellulosilyticus TaxID=2665665 RepID=A0ABW2PWL5_9BACL
MKLHFFHLPYLSDGPAIEQLLITFILMMHMCFLGFTVSSLLQRFGRNGMYVLSIAALLFFTIIGFLCTYFQWWGNILGWLSYHSVFYIMMWTIPVIVIYMIASYCLPRRATL